MNNQLVISFAVIVVLVTIVVGTLHTLWRERRERVKVPSCAACGYPVSGLGSFTCPECGIDLRAAGILTPDLRFARRPGFFYLACVFTCTIALIALIATGVASRLPITQQTTLRRSVSLASPQSLFGRVSITTTAVRTASGYRDTRLNLTLVPTSTASPRPHSLIIREEPASQWTATTAVGVTTHGNAPLTRADLIAWVEATGVSVNTDARHAEIDELFATINDARTQPGSTAFAYTHLQSTANSGGTTTDYADWFLMGFGTLWSVLWLLGLILIRRITKRRAARPRTEHRPPLHAS